MSFDDRTQNEKKLYKPIRDFLIPRFAKLVEKPKKPVLQSDLISPPENLYMEIVGEQMNFSDKLKREFDDETLNIITSEKCFPDIVGFIKEKADSPKKIIVVEIKDRPLKLKDIAQAKFYEDIFNSKFTLLVSSEGIPEEKVRFLLKNPRLRGNVIPAQYFEKYGVKNKWFEIHQKFENIVPDFLKEFCK
jgi:hypothetical protein